MAIIYSGFDTVTGKFRYSDGANFSLSDQPPNQATYAAYAPITAISPEIKL